MSSPNFRKVLLGATASIAIHAVAANLNDCVLMNLQGDAATKLVVLQKSNVVCGDVVYLDGAFQILVGFAGLKRHSDKGATRCC